MYKGNSTVIYGTKFVFFSTLRTCSDHISSNKLWLHCPIPSIKDCLPSCKTFFFVAFTNSEKKERDLRDIFVQAFCDLQSVAKLFTSGELHRVLKLILRHKKSFWLFKDVKCYQISQCMQ